MKFSLNFCFSFSILFLITPWIKAQNITILTPLHESIQIDTAVKIQWENSVITDTFLVEIYGEDTNNVFFTGITTKQTISINLANGNYKLRIKSFNNNALAGFSKTHHFKVFNIGSIPNLTFNFSADTGVIIGMDGVERWESYVNSIYGLEQPLAVKRPAYDTTTFKDFSYLSFDGIDDAMRSQEFSLINDYNYFLLFRSKNLTGDIFDGGIFASHILRTNFNPNFQFFNGNWSNIALAKDTSRFFLLNIENHNGSLKFYEFNQLISQNSNAGSNASNGLTVGAIGSMAGNFSNLHLHQIIGINNTISDSLRSVIVKYLENKASRILNLPKKRYNTSLCDVNIHIPDKFKHIEWSDGDNALNKSFSSSGHYWLRYTNIFNETHTDSFEILIQEPFYYTLPDTTICKGDFVTWNTSLPNTYSFLWSTGATDSAISITQGGDYWVQVTDSFGCSITSDTIRVEVDDFSRRASLGGDTILCTGDSIGLIDGEELGASFNWSMGANTPKIAPASSGTYVLAATGTEGCTVIDTIFVDVAGLPPSLDFDATSVCAGDSLFFQNLSSPAAGDSFVSQQWSFGDGQSDSSFNAQHVFAEGGIYTVRLDVETSTGCRAGISKQVQVYHLPTPNIDIENSCSGQEVRFSDQSTAADTSIGSTFWRVKDRSSQQVIDSAASLNFTVLLADSGQYDLQGSIVSNHGCAVIIDSSFYVNRSPIAAFSRDSACAGEAIQFQFDGEANNGNFQWQFGDGSSSQQQNPVHNYSQAGDYNLTLLVSDINQCADSLQEIVRISSSAAIAAPSNPQLLCAGDILLWETGFSSSGHQFLWSDGSTNNQLVISDSGFYEVAVIDSLGCAFESNLLRVDLDDYPLSASLGADTSLCAGNSIALKSRASETITYLWSTNDTGSSLEINAAGNYGLIAQNINGCLFNGNVNVNIKGLAPNVAIGSGDFCAGDSILLSDLSTVSGDQQIVQRFWELDNQPIGVDSAFYLNLSQAGNYNLDLRVVTDSGCENTASSNLQVFALPQPIYLSSLACSEQSQSFVGQSLAIDGQISSNRWIFSYPAPINRSDTLFGDSVSIVHPNIGSFTLNYSVNSDLGCSNQLIETINVNPKPEADFTVAKACADENSLFTPNNIMSGSSSEWLVDSQVVGNSHALAYAFGNAGNYEVIYKQTSAVGCVATSSQNISLSLPDVNFNVLNDFDLCLFDSVLWNTELPVQYDFQWSNSDSSASIWITAPGNYAVTVSDTNNCVFESGIVTVGVDSFPAIGSLGADTAICAGNEIGLIAGNADAVFYNWSNGDTTAQIPVFTAGLYVLAAGNANGCLAIDSIQLSILGDAPNTFFSAQNVCLGDTVNFVNSSSPPSGESIASYEWTFGDGQQSNLANPQHFYALPGTYSVGLKAITTAGCESSKTQLLEIYHNPKAQFVQSRSCANANTNFINQSQSLSGQIVSNEWLFSGPQGIVGQSNSQNPTFIFPQQALHTAKLRVSTQFGCVDSITRVVNTLPGPTADFELTSICTNENIQIVNNSSGFVSSQTWDLNGVTSTDANPMLPQPLPQQMRIKLTVNSSLGCADTLTKQFTFVQPPQAAATSTDNVCTNVPVVVNSNSAAGSLPIHTYFWEISKGNRRNIFNSNLVTDSVILDSSGTYLLRLTLSDSLGCSDSTSLNFTLLKTPIPSFDISRNCLSDTVIFTNNSFEDNLNTQYLWTFGNGATSTLRNPKQLYSQAGTFEVNLRATGSNACRRNSSKTLVFSDIENIVQLIDDTVICAADTLIWNSGLNPSQFQIQWFDNDSNFSKTISNAGIYGFAASDSFGCNLITDSVSVSLSNFNQATLFGNDTSLCIGDSLRTLPNLNIAKYQWSTADSSSAIVVNTAGTYQLTATDTNACVAVDSIFISAAAIKPVADFSVNPQCFGQSNQLVSNASAINQNITQYLWVVNGQDTLLGQTPTYTHLLNEKIQLSLQIQTDSNCVAEKTDSVLLFEQPTANFSFSGNCTESPITFTNLSTNSPGGASISWTWEFDDNGSITTSAQNNPNFIYTQAGTQTAKLVVINNFGCSDSVIQNIPLLQGPEVVIYEGDQCLNQPILFADQSNVSNFSSRSWLFSTGASPSADSVFISLSNPGNYNVQLTVNDSNGCSTTQNQNFSVRPLPIYNNQIKDTMICAGDTLFWNPQTNVNYTLRWQDGSTMRNYPIVQTGAYHAIITDTNNCSRSTDTVNISFNPFPQQISLGPDTSICAGDSIALVQGANLASSYLWSDGSSQSSIAVSQSGQYIVNVRNNINCLASDTIMVNVAGRYPQIQTNIPAACIGQNVNFNDLTTAPTGESIASRLWQLSDGSQSTAQNPVFNFGSFGKISWQLTVTTNNGCGSTVRDSFDINVLPIADFTNSLACDGSPTTFFDLSDGRGAPITDFHWNFGSQGGVGNVSNLPQPNFTFNNGGSFQVALEVSNALGCRADTIKTIVVNVSPQANFTADTVCLGTATQFTNTSFGNVVLSNWQFGDNNASALSNPKHFYSKDSIYRALLSITAANGCQDTVSKMVEVAAPPQARFLNDSLCRGGTAKFYNTSVSDRNISEIIWQINNNIYRETNPVISSISGNIVNVSMVVRNDLGCIDSIFQTLPTRQKTPANFELSPEFGQAPLLVDLTKTSNGSALWYVNGQLVSDQNETEFLFENNGIYSISMLLIDDFGCRDSSVKTINITEPLLDLALLDFNWQATAGDYALEISFENLGNRIIRSFEIEVLTKNNGLTKAIWTGELLPGEVQNFTLNTLFPNPISGKDAYTCVLLSRVENSRDANEQNNRICKNTTEQTGIVNVYPSPAEHRLSTLIKVVADEELEIQIVDMFGRMYLSEERKLYREGSHLVEFNITTLRAGAYTLRIIGRDDIDSRPFVKQ